MRILFLTVTLICFPGCQREIAVDNIELLKDGLTYFKNSNRLVDGKVVRYFDNGQIAEASSYVQGLAIGKWYTYGFDGEIVSSGFGEKLDRFKDSLGGVDVSTSVISFVEEGDYKYATIGLYNDSIFRDSSALVKMAKTVFRDYRKIYQIQSILVFDDHRKFTFDGMFLTAPVLQFDTLERGKILTIRVH